jgi:hypothetical protein
LNWNKTILIYCEESGAFADLYRQAGYNVIVCDVMLNGRDIILEKHLRNGVYGFLSFPPCDHLAGSGARWWKDKGVDKLKEGLQTVDASLRIPAIYKPKFWFIENPVGRLVQYIGKPAYYFHPYQFAGYSDESEAYTKKTCLWGQFTKPQEKPLPPVHGSKMHLIPPGENRKQIRSKTPLGFAKAFFEANQ